LAQPNTEENTMARETEETRQPSQQEIEEEYEEGVEEAPRADRFVEKPRIISEVTAADEELHEELVQADLAAQEGQEVPAALHAPIWATQPDPSNPSQTLQQAALEEGDEDYVEGETDEERAERLGR
jgi:hypothetical protein